MGAWQSEAEFLVRLGEAYSIVGEYTSFLVLENDAEYQRWKVERRNALRIERDRKRQRQLDSQLASIRKAVPEDLGPAGAANKSVAGPAVQATRQGPQPMVAPPRPATGGGGNGGGGALDPMTGGIALAIAARALWRRRATSSTEH